MRKITYKKASCAGFFNMRASTHNRRSVYWDLNWIGQILYPSLTKKEKLVTWSTRTLFCIKVLGFEILRIGEKIDRINRFQHPKVYSEPCQTSKMERFVKIVNSFLMLTIFAKQFWIRLWHHYKSYYYVTIFTVKYYLYRCFIYFAFFTVNSSHKIN